MAHARPTQAKQPPATAPTRTKLRCADCGRVFLAPQGARTPRCRRCGSVRCRPTEREVAGGLLSTDQSLDQDRFVRTALWAKLITSEQFAECLEMQKTRAAAGDDVPSLPEVLVECGYLGRGRAAAIFRVLATRTPEQWRMQFGQLALREGFITEAQLREGLEFQTKLIVGSGAAPFLGHILIERGFVSEQQVLVILKAQQQHHIGLLQQLQDALRPKRGKILRAARRHARALLAVGFVLGLAVAGWIGARVNAYASAPPTFDLVCDHCGRRASATADSIAQPCPHCRQGQLCTRLSCRNCGVAFSLRVHSSEQGPPWIEPCPECGTLDHTPLPPGIEGLATHAPPAASP